MTATAERTGTDAVPVGPGSAVGGEPARRSGWRPATVGGSFSSRANSIGFFRWLLAFSVIFSHAGPLAGFYGQEDLGSNWGGEQSLGGVAVAGFFFFSGFLITRSRRGSGAVRYLWRRVLRIMPAYWAALWLTAFVLAPLAWLRERGTMTGFWDAPVDSPFSYVWHNVFLHLGQRNIAEMGYTVPYADIGGYDWNGSAWTLEYEFKAYLMVGVLGIVGWSVGRWVNSLVAVAIIVVNSLMWAGEVHPATWLVSAPGHSLWADPFTWMLLAPFAFGMLFAAWADHIPLSGVVAVVVLAAGVWTYFHGTWNIAGQYGFLYFLMWGAIRFTRLQGWEKYGDFSYGVYIFAWPLMNLACFYGLHEYGAPVYLAVIVVAVHALAFASWHLIEKPAMSLKDWSPRKVPRRGRVASTVITPTNPRTEEQTA